MKLPPFKQTEMAPSIACSESDADEDDSFGHFQSPMKSSQLEIQTKNEQSLEIQTTEKCSPPSTYFSCSPIEVTKVVHAAPDKPSTFHHQRIRRSSASLIRNTLNIGRSGTVRRKLKQSRRKVKNDNKMQPIITIEEHCEK